MPRRLLVGYDHSEEAAAGLRRATALARSERAELTVVHVAVPPPSWVSLGMLTLPLVDDVVASGTVLVRDAVAELPPDLAVRWHLITGAEASTSFCRHRCVRRALRRALESGGHDLLVLGTGSSPGRVSRALLRRCPGRVVTAPFSPQAPVVWDAAAPFSPQAPVAWDAAPGMLPSVSLK